MNTYYRKVFHLYLCFLSVISFQSIAQTYTKIQPLQADGYPIEDVSIWLKQNDNKLFELKDSIELKKFYNAFGIRPGTPYNQFLMSAAIKRILEEPKVTAAEVYLFNTQINGSIWVKLEVTIQDSLKKDSISEQEQTKGLLIKNRKNDFPILFENKKTKLTLLLNGAAGLFNEINGFFGEGVAFTKGNPIADDPASKGVRFWGEAFIEPGIAGITQLGKSKTYVYGAVSGLISSRNTSDLYSHGSATFIDFERLYAGLLWTNLGKQKDLSIDISTGRNFFQLNDAFLISRISGSANAGPRASVYLSSRTAFQKTIIVNVSKNNFKASIFQLEPEELFKNKQQNLRIAGASVDWIKKPNYEIGISYLTINGGTAKYSIPDGTIEKKGMYLFNPKIWLHQIAGTGAYLKTEYAFQFHRKENMRSNAWYMGVGYETKWKWKPNFYYRYAFLSGDNQNTNTYERFDPLLTGGLGLWVQGINNRKLIGNGNIISHRVQIQSYFNEKWDASLDYFVLKSDELLNLGGLAPISILKNKQLGQEITLSSRYFINSHFMLLAIISHAFRGEGMKKAFINTTKDWSSFQLAIFMFY